MAELSRDVILVVAEQEDEEKRGNRLKPNHKFLLAGTWPVVLQGDFFSLVLEKLI